MDTQKSIIHGHAVSYDNSTSAGFRYLARELDDSEAKVFFDQAYNHGFANFEDRMGYNFKLVHHNGEYQIVKR